MIGKLFNNHITEAIAALILGILQTMALVLFYRDTFSGVKGSALNILILLCLWIVCSLLIFLFFRFFGALLSSGMLIKKQESSRKAIDRHPFLISAAVLAVFYLPWITVFYPGSAIYDMMYQTVQADGFQAINAHHPIFSTHIIGLFSKAGLMLTGRLEPGIFFYIIFQTAVCIFAFAYMISFMTKKGISAGFRIFTLCVLAITPLWGGAMQCGTKDILFTGIFVYFIVMSAELFTEDTKQIGGGFYVLYGSVILLLCLLRNGMIALALPTLVVFIIYLAKKKGAWGRVLAGAAAAIILSTAFTLITNRIYDTGTETSEMLSIPFQQTARYVRDHPEEVTAEEAKTIEKVFSTDDHRKLGKRYYPMSSDPVKAWYHWWAADDERPVLKEYFRIWASMLKKHPVTYAEAFLLQTDGYYTILPMIKNQKGGAGTTVQFGLDEYAVENVRKDLVPKSPEKLRGAQNVMEKWYRLWQKIPVVNLLFKCGSYFFLLLGTVIYYAKRKNAAAMLTIPAFIIILMAIASPVNEHIRYIMPVCAAMPLFIAVPAIRKEKIGG